MPWMSETWTFRGLMGAGMPTETTYTRLREELPSVLDRVVDDQEVVIVRRPDGREIALISATELIGLLETADLLQSPKNAARLFSALRKAERGQGKLETVESLRSETGLD